MSTLTTKKRKGEPPPTHPPRRKTAATRTTPTTSRAAAAPSNGGPVAAGVGGGGCEVTCDCIRARAYEIFAARNANGGQGDATSDWLQAERELTGAGTAQDQQDPSIDLAVTEARRAPRGVSREAPPPPPPPPPAPQERNDR